MNNEQIHHMVNRFLSWKLPDDFHPDGGVTFTPSYTEEPMRLRHWPIGTNIFSALQASLMVRHMLEDLPNAEEAQALAETAADEHVRQLVIAAREAWEDATDAEALQRLDKALEPFSEAVPYANEPDRCAVSGTPISPDDWQCGDGKLRAQLALAFAVREPKLIGDPAFQRVIEDLAYEAGKRATTLALSRLMPGVLDDIEIPF